MSISINEEKNRIVRHGSLELAEHWALALSGLALLLSGLFELPVAARYKIITIPGFAWSGDFITSLTIHYVASVVFIVAAFFHLFYHGLLNDRGLIPRKGDMKASIAVVKTFFGKGEEPPFDKYLPEQRLAYFGMAAIIAVIIITGLIKTYKNVYAPDLSHTLVFWSTWLHNIFFVLFILAFVGHIGAIILKPNRPMVRDSTRTHHSGLVDFHGSALYPSGTVPQRAGVLPDRGNEFGLCNQVLLDKGLSGHLPDP